MKKIGLSLAGGGVRGAYEIGAYYALKKCHIKIDGFVGTSIGSFNAAMLAAGRDKELLKFWQSVEVSKLLELDYKIVKAFEDKSLNLSKLTNLITGLKGIIQNKGISTEGLKKTLIELDIEKDLRKSKKDFGLATFNLTELKPIYIFKEQIKEGKLNDYLLGSCYFPGFKLEKIIDDKYYIDGGVFDNSPTNMLLDKGYDKVYIINLSSVGITQKIKDKSKVITIKPSKNLGNIFTLDRTVINNNIKLGYYDTLKVVKNLDGYKYIFKKESNFIYDFLIRKVSAKKLKEMQVLFSTTDSKKLILKALEFVMKVENYEYLNIYNPLKVIKKIKKKGKHSKGVYKFICELKLF